MESYLFNGSKTVYARPRTKTLAEAMGAPCRDVTMTGLPAFKSRKPKEYRWEREQRERMERNLAGEINNINGHKHKDIKRKW